MHLLESILTARGGAVAVQAGQAVGLSPAQAGSALSALVPALTAGLLARAHRPGGLESLTRAVNDGSHRRYIDGSAAFDHADTVTDGHAILGHILGSKDASRAVVTRAAVETGLSADVLKKLLPIAATMVMGALASQREDGSVVDDALGRAGKLFGGR